MAKIIKLNESDLNRLVARVIKEQVEMMDVSSDSDYYQRRKREVKIPFDDLAMLGVFAAEFCRTKENLPDCKDVFRLVDRYNLHM